MRGFAKKVLSLNAYEFEKDITKDLPKSQEV